ncbi:MAG: DUF1501 domain-containing protein, partial [Planctomycetaceae bacterium]|nr:DUF1501 domain-containing protein [Planctomycetaceae bacterium]
MKVAHPQGWTRRDAIRIGALACGGLALPDLLRATARAGTAQPGRCRSVIQISMGGGPSHLDMYDLKPEAPAEVRGEFRPIDTAVPGIQIGEHLPLQAQVFDKLAVIRSGTHEISSHLPASHYITTGHPQSRPGPENTHPAAGAVVSRVIGAREEGLPAYVSVPRPPAYGKSAYLGAAYNPFTTDSEPNSREFKVASLTLEAALTSDRLSIRQSLLKGFDSYRRDLDQHGSLAGIDAFTQEALSLVTSERAAHAFRLDVEPAEVRERYGWTNIGQNCLLARRLVEAGVTYVTCLSGGGWDTHYKNFEELKNTSLPRFDRAVSALVSDLAARGLDNEVLVMAFGEFGRTPTINHEAGRDHWPGAMSMLLAGGGLRMGQVIGAT